MTEHLDRGVSWLDIAPADAVALDLHERLDIAAPHNELGARCPWPWEPQQLVGAPLGQYRCPYCNAMVVAGLPHLDYGPDGLDGLGDDVELRAEHHYDTTERSD